MDCMKLGRKEGRKELREEGRKGNSSPFDGEIEAQDTTKLRAWAFRCGSCIVLYNKSSHWLPGFRHITKRLARPTYNFDAEACQDNYFWNSCWYLNETRRYWILRSTGCAGVCVIIAYLGGARVCGCACVCWCGYVVRNYVNVYKNQSFAEKNFKLLDQLFTENLRSVEWEFWTWNL